MVMDLMIAIWGLDAVLAWCRKNYIRRRGYHGGQFDGNNAKKILEKIDDLSSSCPPTCQPLIDLLRAFHPIVSGCFGQSLDPSYHELIRNFSDQFGVTQNLINEMEGDFKLNVTWKVHILIVHLPEFLDLTGCGMARFSEQCGESVHHQMKATMARFCVSEENPRHGERLKRAVVEFSTERL